MNHGAKYNCDDFSINVLGSFIRRKYVTDRSNPFSLDNSKGDFRKLVPEILTKTQREEEKLKFPRNEIEGSLAYFSEKMKLMRKRLQP